MVTAKMMLMTTVLRTRVGLAVAAVAAALVEEVVAVVVTMVVVTVLAASPTVQASGIIRETSEEPLCSRR